MHPAQAHMKALDGFHQDLSTLSCRLGKDVTSSGLLGAVRLEQVKDAASFKVFIDQYVRHILVPIELPAIVSASTLSARNGYRELLEVDARLGQEPLMKLFAEASRTLGKNQLRKLRGLGDVRILSRYRHSVLEGEAVGWHLLVYGMVLHVFSIPLRHGLAKYQRQVLLGFGQSACHSLQWSETEWLKVRQYLESISPTALEGLIPNQDGNAPVLSIV